MSVKLLTRPDVPCRPVACADAAPEGALLSARALAQLGLRIPLMLREI